MASSCGSIYGQDSKNEVAALNGVMHNLHLVAQDLEKEKHASYSIRPDHVNSCLTSLYKLDEKLQAIGGREMADR
jgi:hypothetical protein